ncbi:DUF4011 domain-containing protein [Larsenimonas suaedae]|uniref:DUF4011 domain-containing protein n=1 Tax=Larsenimonas suaedae TaxID=1851019 RepID=A0ABU1GY75_9GAMM|nr:DUF4011 domain-containing protein [Larsenimonas suaedae]MCM2972894.1 DUF4011 domain-containing protein [Larsenimonas suaedae]MDR5896993.1 DUF4011 domain-containing protein [Larsenimonas suaedae]
MQRATYNTGYTNKSRSCPMNPINDNDTQNLVAQRIEQLRPLILDTTLRNALLNTVFSDKSHSHIRFIDITPQSLYLRLAQGSRLMLEPLPDPEDELPDEHTAEFQRHLAEQQNSDERYLTQLQHNEKADLKDSERDSQNEKALRELKDRIRHQLKLPARVNTQGTLEPATLARLHGFNPSYDLPEPDLINPSSGKNSQKRVQTLMFPKRLELRATRIRERGRSSMQETGMQVLQCAIGFLEMQDNVSSKVTFAPLVLMPITISECKTPHGLEHHIECDESQPTGNAVLSYKLHNEFGLRLPPPQLNEEGLFDIEDYYRQIESLKPKTFVKWQVRRQAAAGVWAVQSLIMYEDAGAQEWQTTEDTLISRLLGNYQVAGEPRQFLLEHAVDEPEIEQCVPLLVSDADSSQYSAIVDVMQGTDLALEGPPGTGKSQTIVNAIAAALSSGRKILFIAEKQAALEVVNSRLDAMGLGSFILNLQANKTREQIKTSLCERLEMQASPHSSAGLEEIVAEYREVRSALADYINLLTSPYRQTGLTIHDVLGRGITAQAVLALLPRELRSYRVEGVSQWSDQQLDQLASHAENYADLLETLSDTSQHWHFVQTGTLDRFSIDSLLELAGTARDTHEALQVQSKNLLDTGLSQLPALESAQGILSLLSTAREAFAKCDPGLLRTLLNDPKASKRINNFLEMLHSYDQLTNELGEIAIPVPSGLDATLNSIIEQAEKLNLTKITDAHIDEHRSACQAKLEHARQICQTFDNLNALVDLNGMNVATILAMGSLLISQPPEAIERLGELDKSDREARAVSEVSHHIASLETQNQKLSNSFDFSQPMTAAQFSNALAELRNKGALSFIFPKLRQTRRMLKSTLLDPTGYSDKRMLAELPELTSYLADLETFEADEQYTRYSWFRGMRTDINILVNLHTYRQEAQKLALEHRSPRLETLLLDTPAQRLSIMAKLFSEIDSQVPEEILSLPSLAELPTFIKTLNQTLEDIDSLDEQITEGLISLGQNHEARNSVPSLRSLYNQLQKREALAETIERHDAALLLETNFDGISTDRQVANNERVVAESLQAFPTLAPVVLEHMTSSEHLASFEASIASWTETHEAYDEQLARLERDTHATRSEWGFDPLDPASGALLAGMSNDNVALDAHARRNDERGRMTGWGIDPLIKACDDGIIASDAFVEVIKATVSLSMARDIHEQYREKLTRFRGKRLDDLRDRLAKLDRRILELSRDRLVSQLIEQADPPSGYSGGRVSERTELSLIQHVTRLKRNTISPRALTDRAGEALRELKPCWLMSPLAVAAYLPRIQGLFDLVVIDEGSQMRPENALGGLLRAKQALVVGDTEQLPPTNNFRKLGNVVVDDEEENDDTLTSESILDVANLTLPSRRRLRWHYRSRHESLIAFCNRHIYKDDLVIFPSPTPFAVGLGVSQVFVEDGLYKSSLNQREAQVMVSHILRFMSDHPERSLGVVVLNNKQQTLLQDEYDAMRQHSTIAQRYEDHWQSERGGLEPFFIKNLENVQGDERDVIFIGTVFGPEEIGGKVMNRFGNLSGAVGRRRLNVLFTRAKSQIVTFTSMKPNDIKGTRDSAPGSWMLRKWLEYSATGELEAGEANGAEPDSDFERHVIQVIRALGYEAIPQVGAKGFFIDIGVRHPDYPYGYLLGVECDGASYHSSRSARDRDRLRQEILEAKGWQLHRIWSTDWFTDPLSERDRLKTVLDARLAELKHRITTASDNGPSNFMLEQTANNEEFENLQHIVPD